MNRLLLIILSVLCLSADALDNVERKVLFYKAPFDPSMTDAVDNFMRDISKRWNLEIFEKDRRSMKILSRGHDAFFMALYYTDEPILIITNGGGGIILTLHLEDYGVFPQAALERLDNEVREGLKTQFGILLKPADTGRPPRAGVGPSDACRAFLREPSSGIQRCRRAAEQGDAQAQFDMGSMYALGRGVQQDAAEALALFQSAAAKGHRKARSYIAFMYTNRHLHAAKQGDSDAQVVLALMYATGLGVPRDDGEAVAWYRRAAENGHRDAQALLGLMHGAGRGVAQNDDEAIAWIQRAAENDQRDAQNLLSTMYHLGIVLPQDTDKGSTWVERAIEDGSLDAQPNIRLSYVKGPGIPRVFIRIHMNELYRGWFENHERP